MIDKLFAFPELLVNKFGTRDPFRIAKGLGIVVYHIDTKKQKGMCRNILSNYYIWINSNMSYEMQRMACAHELGHIVLHQDLLKNSKFLVEMEIFDIKNTTEYEANLFAANLLIDDDEMREYFKNGYDYVSTASALNVNVNMLLIKISGSPDLKANIPFSVNRKFMGYIDDRADSI